MQVSPACRPLPTPKAVARVYEDGDLEGTTWLSSPVTESEPRAHRQANTIGDRWRNLRLRSSQIRADRGCMDGRMSFHPPEEAASASRRTVASTRFPGDEGDWTRRLCSLGHRGKREEGREGEGDDTRADRRDSTGAGLVLAAKMQTETDASTLNRPTDRTVSVCDFSSRHAWHSFDLAFPSRRQAALRSVPVGRDDCLIIDSSSLGGGNFFSGANLHNAHSGSGGFG